MREGAQLLGHRHHAIINLSFAAIKKAFEYVHKGKKRLACGLMAKPLTVRDSFTVGLVSVRTDYFFVFRKSCPDALFIRGGVVWEFVFHGRQS